MQNLSDIPSDQSIPSAQEAKRLEALRRFEILDTLPEQSYEDIAYLASHSPPRRVRWLPFYAGAPLVTSDGAALGTQRTIDVLPCNLRRCVRSR